MTIDTDWAAILMLWTLIVGLLVGYAFGFIHGTRAISALANEQEGK